MAKSFDINKSKSITSIEKVAEKSKVIGLEINRDSEEIPIQQLEPSEKNFYSLEDIEDLKDSIKLFGVLQPLLVEERKEEGIYKVIAGHRRLIAATEIGLKKLPCIIKQGLTDTDFELMLIHANKYREKSDMERAKEIKLLAELIKQKKGDSKDDSGVTMKMVADELDMSVAHAKRLNNLNKLIPEIQKMLDSKKITATAAEKFSSLSVEAQKEIYETILNTGKKINKAEADELRSQYKSLQNELMLEVNNLIAEKETEIQKLANENKVLDEKIKELSHESKQDNTQNNDDEIKNLKDNLAKAEKEKKKLEKQLEKEKKAIEDERSKSKEIVMNELSKKATLNDIINSARRASTGLRFFFSKNDNGLNEEDKKLLQEIREVATEILDKLN